jgi:hypothetical protein
MASVHSQQLAKQLFTRLTYSALLATLLFKSRNTKTTLYDKLVPTDFLIGLFTTRRNKKVEAAVLASLLGQNSASMAKCSIPEMETIQKGTEVLYQQLEQAQARIKKNVQKNRDLAERLARSPRAIKTIKDLDAAIATITPVKPTAEYEVSEYATGNRCWRRTPYQHPVSIQDLLLHDIQTHQEKNKLLGEKVDKIVLQNQFGPASLQHLRYPFRKTQEKSHNENSH